MAERRFHPGIAQLQNLLFRFDGVSLLRFAARQFWDVLLGSVSIQLLFYILGATYGDFDN